MVELTKATAVRGMEDCFKAVTDLDSLPTYAGIGLGAVGGNIAAKFLAKLYSDPIVEEGGVPNKYIEFALRTVGRLGTSAVTCGLSGSAQDTMNEMMKMAAVGSSGMIIVDILRMFAPEEYQDYLTLQDVKVRKPHGVRTALQPPVRGGAPPPRVAPMPVAPGMPHNGGIVGGKQQQPFTSSRVSGK